MGLGFILLGDGYKSLKECVTVSRACVSPFPVVKALPRTHPDLKESIPLNDYETSTSISYPMNSYLLTLIGSIWFLPLWLGGRGGECGGYPLKLKPFHFGSLRGV